MVNNAIERVDIVLQWDDNKVTELLANYENELLETETENERRPS